jgi:hypothetical protein
LYEYTTIVTKKLSKSKDNKEDNKEEDKDNINYDKSNDVDPSTTKKMGDLFAKQSNISSEYVNPIGLLTYIFPLVDLILIGPFNEDNDKFSISLSRKDGKQMKVLKRDEDNGKLNDHLKPILSLIFDDRKTALTWRQTIETHMVTDPTDIIINNDSDTKVTMTNVIKQMKSRFGNESTDEPLINSMAGMMVIPTSGSEGTEKLKIEIAKTLSNSRR